MKLDVKVKNLGKIKEAEFHIRPMTVITGPNGTGKSFFTKSLYSILNVANKNVYHEWVVLSIKNLYLLVSSIGYIAPEYSSLADKILFRLNELENEFQEISAWKINEYLNFCSSKVSDVEKTRLLVGDYADNLILKLNNMSINTTDSNNKPHSMDVNFVKRFQETNNNFFEVFLNHLKKSQIYYAEIFSAHIQNEFKENFQVSDLSDLIGFGEEQLKIEVDDLLMMELNSNQQFIISDNKLIDEIIQLSSVVFFESPAYWKVRDALIADKNSPKRHFFVRQNSNDILTGVPKYFYELDDLLNLKTKTPGRFKYAFDLLKDTIGGEFSFQGDDLRFTDKEGQEISKHLVSFGMTNLGMIQALLKHNIITEGSFIFIDEPEANLHPDWQVKLVEVLLILAKGGVNVVITTHSSDLMKALEVKIKKQQIDIMEDFLSVHFMDVDGKLLEFESEEPIQQLIEARSLLNAAYEELYFSDL